MPPSAQHRQQQDRADQRRQQSAGQQHDEVGHCRICIQHGRGVGTDAEEGGAGEIQHSGVTELNVQPKRRHGVEQHGDHQQQDEMVFMKIRGEHECPDDGEATYGVLVVDEGPANAIEQTEPGGGAHSGDAERQQCDDDPLLLGAQQRDQIGSRKAERDQSRPQPRARFRAAPRHRLRPAH
jgi:hypothetical protein